MIITWKQTKKKKVKKKLHAEKATQVWQTIEAAFFSLSLEKQSEEPGKKNAEEVGLFFL